MIKLINAYTGLPILVNENLITSMHSCGPRGTVIRLGADVRKVALSIDELLELMGRRKEKHMAKYRKKPVIVEAYQTDEEMDIPTLEGVMHANVGDYIITGVQGEQYPCKPDIFEETYEKVPIKENDNMAARKEIEQD